MDRMSLSSPERMPERPRDVPALPEQAPLPQAVTPVLAPAPREKAPDERDMRAAIQEYIDGRRADKPRLQFDYDFINARGAPPEKQKAFDDAVTFVLGSEDDPRNATLKKEDIAVIAVVTVTGDVPEKGEQAVVALDRLGKVIGYAD